MFSVPLWTVGISAYERLRCRSSGLLNRACAEVDLAFHYGHAQGGLRSLISRGRRVDVKVYNCRMSPRSAAAEHILLILALAVLYRIGIRGPARRNAWLRSLLDADVVADIRGGDSFSDIYGLGRFVTGSLPLLTVAVLGRPYHMLPQTSSQTLSDLALARSHSPAERRHDSHEGSKLPPDSSAIVRTFGAVLSGRRVYTGGPSTPASRVLARWPQPRYERSDNRRQYQWPVVHGRLYRPQHVRVEKSGPGPDGRTREADFWRQRRRGSSSCLTSRRTGPEACTSLLQSAGARHPGRVFMLSAPLDERETKWVIGRMDFFVGARMHACIAALSQGCPQ